MELHFHYDIVCPYAYLASTAIEELAARVGAELIWQPVLLGGILRTVGAEDVPSYAWAPARAAMGAKDLLRQAQLRGVPFAVHPRHPVRTLDAMRLITAASPEVRVPLSHALFEAYHTQGLDLADRGVLGRLAGRFGLSIDVVDRQEIKDELRARTDLALERGMFGVPGFWARTTEHPAGHLWWGADRMHLVEAAMRGFTSRQDAPDDLQHEGASDRPVQAGGRSELELFHDFSSPFSYLGASQAPRIAAMHGATLTWRPMLLGALFRTIGTADVPIAVMNAAKARYYLQDLHDWADWWGVPFAFPACFPVRTVTALRVSIIDPRVIQPIYRALWAEGRDIGDDAVLRSVIAAAGLDPASVDATAAPAVKQQLRDNTDLAASLGACGAPTFRVRSEAGGGAAVPDITIWGQDRFDLVGACLDGWRPTV